MMGFEETHCLVLIQLDRTVKWDQTVKLNQTSPSPTTTQSDQPMLVKTSEFGFHNCFFYFFCLLCWLFGILSGSSCSLARLLFPRVLGFSIFLSCLGASMDSDEAKLFVGGISRVTSEVILRKHFDKYGTVLGSSIAKDRITKNSRGFGFVWFSDSSAAHKALQDSHVILGKTVSSLYFVFFFLFYLERNLNILIFIFCLVAEKIAKFTVHIKKLYHPYCFDIRPQIQVSILRSPVFWVQPLSWKKVKNLIRGLSS